MAPRYLVLLATLALAVPSQADGLLDLGQLDASHAQLGTSLLQGTANALTLQSLDLNHNGTFILQLVAEEMDVRVDHSQSYADAGVVIVQGDQETGSQWSTSATYQNATLSARDGAKDFHVALIASPLDALHVTQDATCLELAPPSVSRVPDATDKYATSPTPLPTVSVEGNLEADGCGLDNTTATGDVLLEFWGVNFTAGHDAYHTGSWTQPLRGPTGEAEPIPSTQLDQAFIHAKHARLTLTRATLDGSSFRFYLHAGHAGAAEATITPAQDGQALGPGGKMTPLRAGAPVAFTGQLQLAIAALQGSGFPVHVQGPAGTQRDGRPITPASSRTAILNAPVPWSFWGAFAAVLAGGTGTWAGVKRRQRRLLGEEGSASAERHYQLAQDLVDMGAPHMASLHIAALHLHRALRQRPLDPYAHLLLAQIHDQEDHPKRCLRHAARSYSFQERIGSPDDAWPEAAYLCSRSHALLGHPYEAVQWLRVAVRHDPGRAQMARDDPAFFPLWDDLDYQEIINGPIAAHGKFTPD